MSFSEEGGPRGLPVNLDTFDWNKNKHLCIINGIITDRRLMGNSINLPSYRTARRGREYGYENCERCGELYAKSLRCNHNVSRVHMDFIKGEKAGMGFTRET